MTSHELYDGQLRLRQTQLPAAEGGRVLTDMFYDTRGQQWKTNGAYFNADAAGTTLFGVIDNVVPGQTIRTFDGAGRPTATAFRTLGVEKWRTTTAYSGDRVTVDPPDGGTPTTTITDARGRTVELRQYRAGSPTGAYDSTRYTHDDRDALLSVTDPAGNVWRHAYDIRGRKIRSEDPDRGTTTFAYNDANDLVSTTDSRNRTLAYAYDALGRQTGVFDGSLAGAQRVGQVYDTLAKGMPTSSTRYDGGAAYTTAVTAYDDGYRPTGTSTTIPSREGALAGTYLFRAGYTPSGLLSFSSFPAAGGLGNEAVSYTYDSYGQALTAGSGLSTYVTNTRYTKFGELNYMALSTGGPFAYHTRTYEEGTRRAVRTTFESQTAAGRLSDLSYTYDPAGNITRIADSPTSGAADVQCFRYDYLRRMTDGWTPGSGDCAVAPATAGLGGPARYWHSFTYDSTGNRQTETQHAAGGDTTRTYAHPAAGQPQPHTTTSVRTVGPGGERLDEYGYDAAGHTTSRSLAGSAQALEWDVEGRLSRVTAGVDVTSFLYGADGGRLIRRDKTGSTLYLGAMEIHADTVGVTKATRYYSHGDQTVAMRTSAGVQWLSSDHQGTSHIAMNAATAQVTQRRFTPFGSERGTPATWPGQRGFLGAPTDPLLGLTHLGAREYDPSLGQFLSVDPLIDVQNPQQMHGYSYASNSPVTYSDPSGLIMEECHSLVNCYGYSPTTGCPHGCGTTKNQTWGKAKYGTNGTGGAQANKRDKAQASVTGDQLEQAKKIKNRSIVEIAIEAGGEILKEVLGINDIQDCLSRGDLVACASFVVGMFPWGKLLKVGKIAKALLRAWEGIQAWRKQMKWANTILGMAARAAPASAAKADEVAAAAGKKADGPSSCPVGNSFAPDTLVLMGDGSRKR
ncbi:MAG: RHS repeat-associated core domain-containing protein, partial [Pseudonocardia sp.]|nr:RHS repeat-associated core domain-containing protein [Pseudonocardia sp.]